ncbi:phosphoribosylformylglycinamidine synthase subunit PurQ [Cuniculiplasma sp. SKW3]|uniref:phosphoribosylformylglycinamidine synthase subunit PurQ n=1 Tax=Cuniculiplasma sp. SKW3 TaxID=3400170 RepID=UPI003FD58C67
MDSKPLKAGILRMEGTNNDSEAFRSFQEAGLDPQYIHIWEIEHSKVNLEDFNVLFIPGGFSAGDYVRAGAIFAARLKNSSEPILRRMVEDGTPIIGPCNGFQVLTETGMIGSSYGRRDIALDVNRSGRFECRTIFIKYTGKSKLFDGIISRDEIFEVPVAHKEGNIRFMNDSIMEKILEEERNLFTYVNPEGGEAEYPWNPNGSIHDIAGISGEYENVIGLMPHPERIYYPYQLSTNGRREKARPFGEIFFSAIKNYIQRKN